MIITQSKYLSGSLVSLNVFMLICHLSCDTSPPSYLNDRNRAGRDAAVEIDPLTTQDLGLTVDQGSQRQDLSPPQDQSLRDASPTDELDSALPFDACISVCDCTEGQACVEGRCAQASQPTYCCAEAECPAGNFCEQEDGSRALCPSNGCQSACDCPTGQACVEESCLLSEELGLTYCCEDPACPSGRICELPNGETSECRGETECAVTCDCQSIPGTACRGGRCLFPSLEDPLVVCCETDCITGLTCEREDGTQEICP